MREFIDIVFDGPPAHESGRFIEVEDPSQASISVGEWVEDGQYWRLRIRPDAFGPSLDPSYLASDQRQAEWRDRISYTFGHLVGSYDTTDAHAADSGDLAAHLMDELRLTDREQELMRVLAEEVAGNYKYAGEADEFERRVKAGEI